MKRTKKPKTKVIIIESEAGWGQRVDEVREFAYRKNAEKFVEKFNAPNVRNWKKTKTTPSWYMYAKIIE